MNLFESTVPQLAKMLRNLDSWLGAAILFAERKKFDVNQLLTQRLAPDQLTFARQIQIASDNAKALAARLAGKEAPAHPDVETTVEQLRARIATAITYLETIKADDLTGGEERRISLPWMEGSWMRGDEYVTQFGLPNFYFHVTTAYSILRHNGVDLGKRDFIGGVPRRT